jgi:TolB protein
MQRVRVSRTIFVFFVAMFFAAIIASSTFAGAPTGTSPNDPLAISGEWQFIAPNTSLWFYFDYVADRTRAKATIAINTSGIDGLKLAIYTPAQAIDWQRDSTIEPVGRGTPYRDTVTGNITRDLFWWGAFNRSDRYFAVVTNDTPYTIYYQLTATGDTVNMPTATPPTPMPTPFFSTKAVPVDTIKGKIVFETATGGDIYTVNGDGSNLTKITSGIDPSWSPDGSKITFARWGNANPGLFVINANGSNEQFIYGSQRIRGPRWSPNGKYIAFTQDKTKNERNPLWKLGVIELNKFVDAETTKNTLTEPQCSATCNVPSWTPDSQALFYADPNIGIMTTNIISGSASLVLGPQGSYYDTGANVIRPILHMPQIQSAETSPDGKRIVYAQPAHDRWEVNAVNADGGNQIGLTGPEPFSYVFFFIAVHNVAPTWSPDGQQILFLSDRNGKWEFFVMNADGSNIRQVLKNVTDTIPLRFDYYNERMMDWIQ